MGAAEDFEAAMHEIESNLEVRRLMFVIANVLVPTITVGMVDSLAGSEYPPEIAWLPANVLWIAGLVLALAGLCVSAVLTRSHFGLVVNGSKMRSVTHGHSKPRGLNWLGVTTNFVALTAMSSAAGAALFCTGIGQAWLALLAVPALLVLPMLLLQWNHFRASKLSALLSPEWPKGEVPKALQEQHARRSLDATIADVSVVVTMAGAVFAGTFAAMSNVGSIQNGFDSGVPATALRAHGITALSSYTLVSLLLTARMVVRLRIALAEHSASIAALRGEHDDPWRFRIRERTWLLYLLLVVLLSCSALILGWTLGGQTAGIVSAIALAALSVVWFPLRLKSAAKRARA